MQKSKRRIEMGEQAWSEYQKTRQRAKYKTYIEAHPDVSNKYSLKVTKSRQNKKRLLVDYKGGKCEKCGLKSHIMELYDFHHINPSKKEFGLAAKCKNLSLERCKVEVDKCLLVCKNCHAIIHHELYLKKHGLL